MTRTEAKLVAEELHKLMRKEIKQLVEQYVDKETDEWLSSQEAAKYMGVSLGFVIKSNIPHSKIGNRNKYRRSDLRKLMER